MAQCTKNSLHLLNAYDSTDESEDEIVPIGRVSTKRTVKHILDEDNNKSAKRLPLPEIMKDTGVNFEIEENQSVVNRIRSFPHERGNWATFLFLQYENTENMTSLVNKIIAFCDPICDVQPVEDFHLSLSKTVILKYHWIDSFVATVKDRIKLSNLRQFIVLFDNIKIYTNEEKTRTFLGFEIRSGFDSLKTAVQIFDASLDEFKLPTFYKDPSFHVSIAWILGDHEKELNSIIYDLRNLVQSFMEENSDGPWFINVNSVYCKSGNKLFAFCINER